jgi:DUF917 family protein
MRLFDRPELTDLALHAAVLGAGDGDPYLGSVLAEQETREHGPVEQAPSDGRSA